MCDNSKRTITPGCPRCHHHGFTVKPAPADSRPQFQCMRCGHTWTAGLMGSVYLPCAKPTEAWLQRLHGLLQAKGNAEVSPTMCNLADYFNNVQAKHHPQDTLPWDETEEP